MLSYTKYKGGSNMPVGEELKKISGLVVAWRKSELQSWSNLLNVHDERHCHLARRYWTRLYFLLIINLRKGDNGTGKSNHNIGFDLGLKRSLICSPKWVWKGVFDIVYAESSMFPGIEDYESNVKLAKVVDAFFCLTSGIGLFDESILLIDTFANHIL